MRPREGEILAEDTGLCVSWSGFIFAFFAPLRLRHHVLFVSAISPNLVNLG
jgi:hypothetical protein